MVLWSAFARYSPTFSLLPSAFRASQTCFTKVFMGKVLPGWIVPKSFSSSPFFQKIFTGTFMSLANSIFTSPLSDASCGFSFVPENQERMPPMLDFRCLICAPDLVKRGRLRFQIHTFDAHFVPLATGQPLSCVCCWNFVRKDNGTTNEMGKVRRQIGR